MYLLIDDIRDGYSFDVVARTFSSGMKMLLSDVKWTCVCFDHDLGIDSETRNERTGYELLTWALENNKLPSKVELITSNPVGLLNMGEALKAAGYTQVNPREFVK